MSASILNPRSTRRIARSTGLDIARGWSHGGNVMGFVTADRKHGTWDSKTGQWKFTDPSRVLHYTSCHELFPDDFPDGRQAAP